MLRYQSIWMPVVLATISTTTNTAVRGLQYSTYDDYQDQPFPAAAVVRHSYATIRKLGRFGASRYIQTLGGSFISTARRTSTYVRPPRTPAASSLDCRHQHHRYVRGASSSSTSDEGHHYHVSLRFIAGLDARVDSCSSPHMEAEPVDPVVCFSALSSTRRSL